MGSRLRKRMVILCGSLFLTIFSFQLTGFNTLKGDEESQRFANDALPSNKAKFRTFSPLSMKEKMVGKSIHSASLLKGQIGADTRDTRRTLQDIRTADDIKRHTRISESPGLGLGKNATTAMTTRLQFERLFPALLEEEKCPLCYGTGNCDQIYMGNISFHVGRVNLSEPHAIPASWGGRRVLGKRLVKRALFQRLEQIICRESLVDPGRSCEVNSVATNSWMSKSSALNKVPKLHLEIYESSVISLSATTCSSLDFLDQLKRLYGVSRWPTGIQSTKMAILAATLALDPEPALLKFFRNVAPLQPYFPEYLGECGRVILTEPSGKPLVDYLKASWEDRVDVSLKVLQMVEDFHASSDKWLIFMLDFDYKNFAVTPNGQLKVTNLGGMVVVDKAQTSSTPDTHPQLHARSDVCNEDCLNAFVKRLHTDPTEHCREIPRHVEFMYMMACHSLLSDLFTTKFEQFFQSSSQHRKQHPGGLLRDAPHDVDSKLSELLYECVYESQPGRRMHSVRVLKHLLRILKRGFAYQLSPTVADTSL